MARITLSLTPAQLRMVNSALAFYEAEDHDMDDDYRYPVMNRTRRAVWATMAANKVEP